MIAQEELDQQQQMNVNKERLMYSSPLLIVLGTMREVKGPGPGVSEHICGCGIGS
jgi:hypothetical protein